MADQVSSSLMVSISWLWLLLLSDASYGCFVRAEKATAAPVCKWESDDNCAEKHMVPMEFEGTTYQVYRTPDVSTFYREQEFSRKPRQPKFNGLFGKFVNISPNPVEIYWDGGGDPIYIAEAPAFGSAATATFPTHKFIVKSKGVRSTVLTRWVVVPNHALYIYDAIEDGHVSVADFDANQLKNYEIQKRNLEFGEAYQDTTGVEWLSVFPFRHEPLHPMWPADYFGQEHWVETEQTHFVSHPPASSLKVDLKDRRAATALDVLAPYRSEVKAMNMTLKVLSCAPRVYEIQNFLSEVEVDHVMELATGSKLHKSTTKAGNSGKEAGVASTRTSKNSWINREKSAVIDSIYRRAADLLRVDEKLLRQRNAEERISERDNARTMAEHLQLVHYEVGQQYTPHHDFSIPSMIDGQPMRFATILFYLNVPEVGGETAFPRYLNAETSEQLKVKPEVGKAILFYNLLPDGNMDERSQHAALPVVKGEKWLINLWFWDPEKRF